MELKSIGYMEVSNVARNSIGTIPRVPDPEEAIAALPRPDLSQMIPYKPKVNPLPGEHPVPGMFLNVSQFLLNIISKLYYYIIMYIITLLLYRRFLSVTTSCSSVVHYIASTWLLQGPICCR